MRWAWLILCLITLAGCSVHMDGPLEMPPPAPYPQPVEHTIILKNFHLASNQSTPDNSIHIHLYTLGTPKRNAAGQTTNAILIMHGTTGDGTQFLVPGFGGQLFGKGQPLDAQQFFIILPDDLGHGLSSCPSEALRAAFPNYNYADMVEAEFRAVTEGLNINHLRLVMGTSMGGMHTWLWGESHPAMMDALLPLASLPEQISGRNRLWRKMIIDDIRLDPQWNAGNYTTQPNGLANALGVLFFMSSNPAVRYHDAPTGTAADKLLQEYVASRMQTMDANDVLYAVESSRDYDPGRPGALEKITAPLLAINSADDLINPPDLDIMQRQIKRVKNARFILLPESPATHGHGTHTMAWIWHNYLEEFLRQTAKR
ncbi:MAG TPA: alpha/beta fold hydrolase [Phycisphaerae bacterium]|jgi:homoserine O-acetyltransferase